MTTLNVQPQLDLIASNIRYGLARRGYTDASGLVEMLEIAEADASDLYSGKKSYTVGQLGLLAAHFNVNPSDLLDENLIVSADDEPEPHVHDFTDYRLRVGSAAKTRVSSVLTDGEMTVTYGFITINTNEESLDATIFNGTAREERAARRAVMEEAERVFGGLLTPAWTTAEITTNLPDGRTRVESMPTHLVCERTKGAICRERQCDRFGEWEPFEEPCLQSHDINLGHVELSRYADTRWSCFVLGTEAFQTTDQIDTLIAQLTTARDRMQSLNDRLDSECDSCWGKPEAACTTCGIVTTGDGGPRIEVTK